MTAPVQQLLLLLLCVTHLSCISEVAAANTGDLWSRIHHVIGSGRGTLLPQTAQRRQQSNGISSASSQRPTISTGSGPAPADRDKKFDLALWKWLKDGGTKLAFAPGYSASGVRGGYATEDIPAGGVILSLPMTLTFKFPADWKIFVALGEQLALEAVKADSPYRPYFDSLPTLSNPHSTLSWDSFPTEYAHLLQAAAMADRIIAMQAATQRYWALHGERLRPLGVTLRALRAAMVTISTRWYEGPTEGPDAGQMALIPAYDLLNHRNGCPVHYDFEPCKPPGTQNETCCVVRTGAPIAKGEEVCNSYNHLTPDLALFQYGFMLPEVEASGTLANDKMPLSIVDVHNFTAADLRRAHTAPPAVFTGTLEELLTERNRQQATLSALEGFQQLAELTKPAESDPDGMTLNMTLKWRQQRVKALAAEVKRLEQAIVVAQRLEAAKGNGQKNEQGRAGVVGSAGAPVVAGGQQGGAGAAAVGGNAGSGAAGQAGGQRKGGKKRRGKGKAAAKGKQVEL